MTGDEAGGASGAPDAAAPDPAAELGLEARVTHLLGAFRLKEEARAGWQLRGISEPESVADHSWGTALLCLLFADEAGVDRERAVAMAVVHDLAEAVTGDVVARAHPDDREVSEAEKAALEESAIDRLLPAGERRLADVRSLWRAYERREDATARFVRDMNLVDMCLQALIYEQGLHYGRAARYDPTDVVPSRGGFEHLDEFFVSAAQRLDGDLAKALFRVVERLYRASRRAG